MKNKSREKILTDLKSIKKPFIADAKITPDSMDCKILTSWGGHSLGGYAWWDIGGPYQVTKEEYNEVKRIRDLGYTNEWDYSYDDNISDEDIEQTENIVSDFSLAMFFVSHKLEFEKDYYIVWEVGKEGYLFFTSKEELEDFIIDNSIKTIPEEYIQWESMTDQELKNWHGYLSDPKLEQWENWKGDDMSDHF